MDSNSDPRFQGEGDKQVPGYKYFQRKIPDHTYVSKVFPQFEPSHEQRRVRIASQVFDLPELHEFAHEHGEVIIRVTDGEREEIKATFYDDSREVKTVTIQRYLHKDGSPMKSTSFTFREEEIEKILNLFGLVRTFNFPSDNKITIDNDADERWQPSEEDKHNYLMEHQELVAEIARNHITEADIIALGYRREQLEVFHSLLNDNSFFEDKKTDWKCRGSEAAWQKFFEQNPWIFGYGLNFIFTSSVDTNKKLEQVISGSQINQSGKRVDALMKTAGFISSLCFVEIKTHKTPLLDQTRPYRPECWRVSNEFSGSIAQIQKTVQKALMDIGTKLNMVDKYGVPVTHSPFLYQPKSYVVIGTLEDFNTDSGINEQQFGSFELFRRNLTNPEVITFDELYERAKFIVEHSETEETLKSEPPPEEIFDEPEFEEAEWEELDLSEEDIPF